MKKIWVKYTKYVQGHLSLTDYFLIDIETTEDKEVMDELCLDWAEKDMSGHNSGFDYYWVIESPSITWLNKECEYTNKKIESLKNYYSDLKETIDIIEITNG